MVIRNGKLGDYAAIDLVYNVDDSVSVDDIHYYISNRNYRITNKDNVNGIEYDYSVGIDSERKWDAQNKKPLSRIAFGRQLDKDFRKLDWHTDKRRAR